MVQNINDPDRDGRETNIYNAGDNSSSGMVLGVIIAFVVLLGIGVWGMGWYPNAGSSTNITVSPPDVVQPAPQLQAPKVEPAQPQPQGAAPSGQGTGTGTSP